MKVSETPLPGAWTIDLDRLGDERGWFARSYDEQELAAYGMAPVGLQANASFNARAGTLRGLHYQREPYGEPKLVRCVRGAIWDVAVDLRPGSPAFMRWHAVELTADNGRAYYLPAGVAHGFQTLTDDAEVHYLMGARHAPEHAAGVRWDDAAFAIDWPDPPPGGRTISERDAAFPDFGAP